MDWPEPAAASTTAAATADGRATVASAAAAPGQGAKKAPPALRRDDLRVSTHAEAQAGVFSPSKAREAVERSLALLAQQLRGEEDSIRAAAEATDKATRTLRADVAMLQQKLSSMQQELEVERETRRAHEAVIARDGGIIEALEAQLARQDRAVGGGSGGPTGDGDTGSGADEQERPAYEWVAALNAPEAAVEVVDVAPSVGEDGATGSAADAPTHQPPRAAAAAAPTTQARPSTSPQAPAAGTAHGQGGSSDGGGVRHGVGGCARCERLQRELDETTAAMREQAGIHRRGIALVKERLGEHSKELDVARTLIAKLVAERDEARAQLHAASRGAPPSSRAPQVPLPAAQQGRGRPADGPDSGVARAAQAQQSVGQAPAPTALRHPDAVVADDDGRARQAFAQVAAVSAVRPAPGPGGSQPPPRTSFPRRDVPLRAAPAASADDVGAGPRAGVGAGGGGGGIDGASTTSSGVSRRELRRQLEAELAAIAPSPPESPGRPPTHNHAGAAGPTPPRGPHPQPPGAGSPPPQKARRGPSTNVGARPAQGVPGGRMGTAGVLALPGSEALLWAGASPIGRGTTASPPGQRGIAHAAAGTVARPVPGTAERELAARSKEAVRVRRVRLEQELAAELQELAREEQAYEAAYKSLDHEFEHAIMFDEYPDVSPAHRRRQLEDPAA